MATLRITEADRDEKGRIRVERTLADLLPKQEGTTPTPVSRGEKLALGLVGLVLVAIYAWGTSNPQPEIHSPARPTAAPTAVSTPVPRMEAYAAPGGILLGTVEATRPMTPTAHYGEGWIQVDVKGSGLIWIKAIEGQPLTGPDLEPKATTAPVYVAQPPTQCAAVGVPGKMVSVCGYDDLATLQAQAHDQWIAEYIK